mmetsp:Transcript_31713/g.68639  ORF Transcript_31713/g.68639 Transcript_31713/m.68639 type:complete len:200 (-) Transcript_31713:134-733(-)
MSGSQASLGLSSHFWASFMNSIMALMAVLKRSSSVSTVTFLMHEWIARSWSFVAPPPPSSTPFSRKRHTLARNLYTPSTLRVLHTLVSLNGPMNISYRRSESAPYAATTSSGLTTLPRLLLILWARAFTSTLGSSLSTYPCPFLTTWDSGTWTALNPWDSGSCCCALSIASTDWKCPVVASWKAVYSTSPRIMPCDTSF